MKINTNKCFSSDCVSPIVMTVRSRQWYYKFVPGTPGGLLGEGCLEIWEGEGLMLEECDPWNHGVARINNKVEVEVDGCIIVG